MHRTLSNWEYLVVLNECQDLAHNRLSKVYEICPKVIRLDFRKKSLVVGVGKYFYKTSTPPKPPQEPSTFAMFLRKYIGGKFMDKFEQYKNDRIYVMTFSNGLRLIFEQFAQGNIILIDKEDKILRPYSFKLTEKKLYKVGQKYNWPEAKKMRDMTFFMGKIYQKHIKGLNDDEIKNLIENPKYLTYDDEISLVKIDDKKNSREYESFSQAIENFVKIDEIEDKPKKDSGMIKLQKRLQQQRDALNNIEKEIKIAQRKTDYLETHLLEIDAKIIQINEKNDMYKINDKEKIDIKKREMEIDID